jgi:hypothetical protein
LRWKQLALLIVTLYFLDGDLQLSIIAHVLWFLAHANFESSQSDGLFRSLKMAAMLLIAQMACKAVLILETAHDGRATSWPKTVGTLTFGISLGLVGRQAFSLSWNSRMELTT